MDFQERFIRRMAENWTRVITANAKPEFKKLNWIIHSYETSDLWDIKWVWEETMKKLFEHWIKTQEDLKKNADMIEKIDLPFFWKRWIKTFLNT